jgi:tRNA(Met) cytidine acetyltransferase
LTGKSLIDWFTKRQTQLSHRQLLLISGDAEWCQQQTEQLLQHARLPTLLLSKTALHFASITNHSFITACQISQYKQQLGTEYNIVIYNAFDGLKPSALYAIEGVIGKSGLLVILCPNFENWAEYEATHAGIAFSFNTQHTTSLFIDRMQQILLEDKSVAHFNQHETHLPFACVSEHLQDDASHNQHLQHDNLRSNLSLHQQVAFNDSLNNMKASKSIGLLTAKRGRGKSTLLGQLAAEIVASNSDAEVYVTAPHINNAQRAQVEYKKIVKHLLSSTAVQIHKGYRKHIKTELEFIAPDQIYHLPKQSILIVDEAAAIAPSILLYACNKFTHVVMATTVAGYEGSGLGFNLRVLPKLKELSGSLTSSFHHAELHKPLRWFEQDALETLFTNIFAPFVTELTLPANQSQQLLSQFHLPCAENKAIDSHYHHLDKKWLIAHDNILTQVVGLLTQSHYQTTPDDLMRLLDASDQHVVVLANSDDLTLPDVLITSVAVIAHEGNVIFPPNDPLLEGILSAQRRVNGHLVAQNLTTTYCEDWFMTAKSWRISRIAVVSEFRRLGLARCLLQYVRHSAEQREVEYLSTSFGLTTELLSFWCSQNYNLMKIGARRDTSSGEHSGIMIASLTKTAVHKFASYYSVAANDIDYFLQHILKLHGNSDSVLLMPDFIQKQPDKSAQPTHSSSLVNSLHKLRVEQFNAKKRSFSNTAASIYARLQNKNDEESKHLQTLFERAHHKNLSKEEKQKVLVELRHKLQNK